MIASATFTLDGLTYLAVWEPDLGKARKGNPGGATTAPHKLKHHVRVSWVRDASEPLGLSLLAGVMTRQDSWLSDPKPQYFGSCDPVRHDLTTIMAATVFAWRRAVEDRRLFGAL